KINVVGVNEFMTEKSTNKFPVLKVTSKILKKQIRRIEDIKQRRDNMRVKTLLNNLKRYAIDNLNLIDPILRCVKEYATIGEISDILREVYGEYKEKNIF
ncbi:MAG: methylmalonyl-CoA mutase, partial [Candidatus Marinimicrobia bacterium]|nr:methylmalonyl-CoA mutase [Candidatus Neomarinimicrobiota bacterium]